MAVQRLHVMGTGGPFDCYQHCRGLTKIYIFLILTNTLHHLHQSIYGSLSMLYVNNKKKIQIHWRSSFTELFKVANLARTL